MIRDSRLRILAVEKILLDNPQGKSVAQIINALECLYQIKADRKTLYADFAALTFFHNLQTYRKGNTVIYQIKEKDA